MQRYRVRMTTSRGTFWMGRSLSDGVCGWVRGTGGASHYQMLTAATKAAQQRWLDIASVFGDVQAIDVVNDQGDVVWSASRQEAQP